MWSHLYSGLEAPYISSSPAPTRSLCVLSTSWPLCISELAHRDFTMLHTAMGAEALHQTHPSVSPPPPSFSAPSPLLGLVQVPREVCGGVSTTLLTCAHSDRWASSPGDFMLFSAYLDISNANPTSQDITPWELVDSEPEV